MNRAAWIISSLIFFSACHNSTADSEVQISEDEVKQSEQKKLAQTFSSLFTYFKSQDSSFTIEKFTESETPVLNKSQSFPIDEHLKIYYAYFIYNQDSSMAIDLYSYNYIPVNKGGKKVFEMAGPDTEVALVDFKNKTRQRILFAGPSVTILDAKWLSPEEVVIAGAEEFNNEKIKPVLWKVQLPGDSMLSYFYSDSIRASSNAYLQQKLENTGIRTSPSF